MWNSHLQEVLLQRLIIRANVKLRMASRNSVKIYVAHAFYHIYNRGVEQRKIFLDEQDYSVFLSYLQTYLSQKDETYLQSALASSDTSPKEKDKALKALRLKNYYNDVDLVCYALLPNHFHLLVKQNKNTINTFMNSLGTRYAMYFNRKYHRKGVLFQDVYKAVLVETNEQLLHLSRYIHINPTKAANLPPSKWKEVPFPSSLPEFLHKRKTDWIKKDHILDYFSKTHARHTYEDFIGISPDMEYIANITIDTEE